ncbi:MAG: gliding motility-associated C-terminal domain-containing protein [Bacteroidia bacterium]|nr:gliding motility-associated C-terminal domain-containing protein [Bacteroidia bacterium]
MSRKLFYILLFQFIFLKITFAQIYAGEDITLCTPQDTNLTVQYTPNSSSSTSNYSIEDIEIDMESLTTPTTLGYLTDDFFSETIDIGFNFCFYGNVYNQLIISTNNYISFETGDANSYSPWSTHSFDSGMLTPPSVTNAIMGPWMDLDPSYGGEITYSLEGNAPFRRFIISFKDFGYFSCTNMQYNGQIKIFESTNVIETHIQDQPLCSDWNAGNSVLGIVNQDGSNFLIQDGWNNTAMTISDEAFRFTPADGENNVEWYDDSGNFIGYGTNMLVSPDTTTTYTISVNECPESYSDEITVFVSSALLLEAVIDDNDCPGEILGAIEINVSGNTSPISYSWTNSNGSFSSSEKNIYNLEAETYHLSITDTLNCQTNRTYTISTPPDPIVIDGVIDSVSCFGFSDGAIQTNVSGGNPPYNYNWFGNNLTNCNSSYANNLNVGEYKLVISDNKDCKDSASFNVLENTTISITSSEPKFNGYNIKCYGGNASVINEIEGGLSPYKYYWLNSESGDTISRDLSNNELKAGEYQFLVKDMNDCLSIKEFTIIQPEELVIHVNSIKHKSCTYNNDAFIEINISGGPAFSIGSLDFMSKSFSWSNEGGIFHSNNQNIYNISEGIYTVKTTDANQCTTEKGIEIKQPPKVLAKYRTIDETLGVSYPFANLYDDSEGNIVEWYWELSNGLIANNENIYNIDLSNIDLDSLGYMYFDIKLVVIDEFGCTDSTYGKIAVKDEHRFFIPNGFSPNFDGKNDYFKIEYHGIIESTFMFEIYDRWGAKLFKTNDPNFEWDGTSQNGKKLPTGTYLYNLSYQDFEYRIYDSSNCPNCIGNITLIR